MLYRSSYSRAKKPKLFPLRAALPIRSQSVSRFSELGQVPFSAPVLAGSASGSSLRPADACSTSPALRDPFGLRRLQNNLTAKRWFINGHRMVQTMPPDSFGPSAKAALGAGPSRFWVPRAKREQKTEDSKMY